MRASTGSLKAIVLLLPLALVIGTALRNRAPDRQQLSRMELDAIPEYVPMDPVSLNLALDDAFAGTTFYRRWTLNRVPDDNGLRIVIFNSEDTAVRQNGLISEFHHNAVYIPELNAIAVDYQLIHELWLRFFPDDQSWGSRANILAWVISHEAGHLLNGDGISHFSDGSVFETWGTCRGDRRELRADAHYVDRVRSWDQQSIDVQLGLFKRILIGEAPQPADGSSALAGLWRFMFGSCNVPEYKLRALRFIEAVAPYGSEPSIVALADSVSGMVDVSAQPPWLVWVSEILN